MAGSCKSVPKGFSTIKRSAFAVYDIFRLEVFGNSTEKLRSHGQEEEFIVLGLVLLIELILKLAQLNVVLGILHIMALIVEVAGKLLGLLGSCRLNQRCFDNDRLKNTPYSKAGGRFQ